MNEEAIQRKPYEQDPFYWMKHAKELDAVAMLIWEAIRRDWAEVSRLARSASFSEFTLDQFPNFNLGGVFWLNAGLALENLFKGIIVNNEPGLVTSGGITGPLRTHNLIRLASRASIKFNVVDAFYLKIGTTSITWARRYPSSVKGGDSKPLIFSESDVNVYRDLFDRIADLYPKDSRRLLFTLLGKESESSEEAS